MRAIIPLGRARARSCSPPLGAASVRLPIGQTATNKSAFRKRGGDKHAVTLYHSPPPLTPK